MKKFEEFKHTNLVGVTKYDYVDTEGALKYLFEEVGKIRDNIVTLHAADINTIGEAEKLNLQIINAFFVPLEKLIERITKLEAKTK